MATGPVGSRDRDAYRHLTPRLVEFAALAVGRTGNGYLLIHEAPGGRSFGGRSFAGRILGPVGVVIALMRVAPGT